MPRFQKFRRLCANCKKMNLDVKIFGLCPNCNAYFYLQKDSIGIYFSYFILQLVKYIFIYLFCTLRFLTTRIQFNVHLFSTTFVFMSGIRYA